MSAVFDAYGRYYDLLYRDKDYAAEVAYVISLLEEAGVGDGELLELGCGTGGHAEGLTARGYRVHGIDLSEAMLKMAAERHRRMPLRDRQRWTFEQADARRFSTERRFDAVVSLFHVLSYQTSDEDVDAFLGNAYRHLRPGGLLIADFWHGPAVVAIGATPQRKIIEDEHSRVTRHAEPETDPARQLVVVNYEIAVEERASGQVSQIRESHAMHYLFPPDLAARLEASGFERPQFRAWMGTETPGEQHWSAVLTARRPE